MKLIITEEQLRLIIENENKGRLLSLPIEMIDSPEKVEKIMERYNEDKERRNFMGFNLIGSFNIGDYPELYDNHPFRELMKEVVSVRGDLILNESSVSQLPKLRYVEGVLELEETMTEELPSLVEVGGDLNVNYTYIDELPLLEKVGWLYLSDSAIKSLPKLREVTGTIRGSYSEIRFLPKLESVGGDANFFRSMIQDLPKLKYVGDKLFLDATPFGDKLREMNLSDEEIKNKFGVNGHINI
jgi:hypothetical protein